MQRTINWIFRKDLDHLPFSERDGYSPFNTLATFALAQGAALTVVAKGEGRDTLVLTIYAVAVLVTLIWIWFMLSAYRLQPDGTRIRAYDEPTIRYGRFTLFWTIVLGMVMSLLGALGLLPNQSTYVAYKGGDIIPNVYEFSEIKGSDRDQSLNKWIGALNDAGAVKYLEPPARLVIIEQSGNFGGQYPIKPFRMSLDCDSSKFVFLDRYAFLRSRESATNPFVYRQLEFDDGDFPATSSASFYVHEARPDERLFVIAYVQLKNPKSKGETPSSRGLGCKFLVKQR